jgi:NADH dehydrogenase FAD-containing subunit
MKVVVIGSGISAIIVAKTFLENNYKVYLIDPGNILDNPKIKVKYKYKFLPDINKSPKFKNKLLINSVRQFKKNYNIKTKNFFLQVD